VLGKALLPARRNASEVNTCWRECVFGSLGSFLRRAVSCGWGFSWGRMFSILRVTRVG